MKITSSLTKPNSIQSDAIIAAAYSDESYNSTILEIDQLVDGQISKLTESKDFKANTGEVLTLFSKNGHRIVLVGLGKKDKCDLGTLQTATSKAIKALVATPANSVSNFMTSLEFHNTDSATACKVIAIAASHAAYRYEATKNFKKDNIHHIESMDLYIDDKHSSDVAQAAAIAEGVETTRELGNLPPNICNPKYLAKKAKKITHKYDNCSLTVLNHKEMNTLKMNALMAVARGSRNNPKMVVMKYNGADKNQKPHALVGKGITFDTGGISLKPGANMDEMKYDM
ncbi:MAG: M17 family metallopeptidase, partial [Marinicellaceae bacterium]